MINEYRDFLIYFGQKDRSICLEDFKKSRYSLEMQKLVDEHKLDHIIVLDQIHTDIGICADDIDLQTQYSFLDFQGDFLATSKKNIGMVVLTADCVPVVLYDPIHHTIAVVHAGWKGTFAGVVDQAIRMMVTKYQTRKNDLKVFFGPSARACCYEVQQDFVDQFERRFGKLNTFFYRNNSIYFDKCLFLQQNLKKFGILESNINIENTRCTICNLDFCSYRREKQQAGRQITMVVLR
jgi:YfiH family protein